MQNISVDTKFEKSQARFYQWAAKGLHRSRCGMFRLSFHRMAASRYTNSIHRMMVGKQIPLSKIDTNDIVIRQKKHQSKNKTNLYAKHTAPKRRCWPRRTATAPGWKISTPDRKLWQCIQTVPKKPVEREKKTTLQITCRVTENEKSKTYQSFVLERIINWAQ